MDISGQLLEVGIFFTHNGFVAVLKQSLIRLRRNAHVCGGDDYTKQHNRIKVGAYTGKDRKGRCAKGCARD